MKRSYKHFSLRIDEELLRKLEFTAKYEDRSINSKLLSMIREEVRNFEAVHGTIDFDSEKQE